MEISDLESSEDEDAEERSRRIEQMAAAMSLMNTESSSRRAELNMDIDTLSERSEDETEKEETKQPRSRSRRPSGRVRSISRERSVAKIRYCWRCHKAGHENWQCREEVQPGGWCPRCLETSHWEDECWVEASAVTCPICSLPGHLPCIHQATDFRQRKLVIDTFGWLPFKEWFQVRPRRGNVSSSVFIVMLLAGPHLQELVELLGIHWSSSLQNSPEKPGAGFRSGIRRD